MKFSRWIVAFLIAVIGLSTYAQDGQINGQVIPMSATLNLRSHPYNTADIIEELPGNTPLIISGRSYADNFFLVTVPSGSVGWVGDGFVTLYVDRETLPFLANDAAVGNANDSTTPSEESDMDTDNESTATTATVTESDARVVTDISGLRVRDDAGFAGRTIGNLVGGTPVAISEQSVDGDWYYITSDDGQQGWVYADYVEILGPPVAPTWNTEVTTATTTSSAANTSGEGGVNVNTPALNSVANIFRYGQTLGNRANVFTMVGDSISAAPHFLNPIGQGLYNLGEHAYLQPTVDYFRNGFNSFANESVAAVPGWTTQTALDPNFANPSVCQGGEIPIVCEYRRVKPAVALIMFGTNDVQYMNSDVFAYNLNRIIEITKENGIIPVLSTIPNRANFEGAVNSFNGVIRAIASAQNIPLWDYATAMSGLPNQGLSGDNMHPSIPPGDYQDSANFTGENLQYGYVVRNLTALQILDTVRKQMLGG